MSDSEGIIVISCDASKNVLGQIARLVAKKFAAKNPLTIIECLGCAATQKDTIRSKKTIVIDGCSRKCASIIAVNGGAEIVALISIPLYSKKHGIIVKTVEDAAGDVGDQLASRIASDIEEILAERHKKTTVIAKTKTVEAAEEFLIYTHGKFRFKVKPGLLYSWNDTWAEILSDGTVRIGITDFMQKHAGDVLFIQEIAAGKEIAQFDELTTFESIKTTLDIICPFSGTVTAFNEKLEADASLINSAPYRDGWIATLKPSDMESEKSNLMDADAYFEFMKKKVVKEDEKLKKRKADVTH